MKRLIPPAVALVVVAAYVAFLFTPGSFTRGKAAFDRQDYAAAREHFEKALAKGKRAPEAHVYLARLDGLSEDYDSGTAHCD